MIRTPRHETTEDTQRRRAAHAIREILDEVEHEYGLCVAAITIDGMIDAIAGYLSDQVGRPAAIRKLTNSVDALARRAPVLRVVPRT